ncbi:MAG: hypothetical protein AAF728_16630 [Cyanobacteria bacterium P01_D01_bin.128]
MKGKDFISVAIALVWAAGMFHSTSTLIFAAMGTLPGQTAYPYWIALQRALAIATLSAALHGDRNKRNGNERNGDERNGDAQTGGDQNPALLAAATTSALMGFFYGGRLTGNNPQFAIAGAAGLGLLGLGIAYQLRHGAIKAAIALNSAIAAYGFAFVMWTSGSNGVTAGRWLPGLPLWGTALVAIAITLKSLSQAVRALE